MRDSTPSGPALLFFSSWRNGPRNEKEKKKGKTQNKEAGSETKCRVKILSQCFRGKTDSRPRAGLVAHLVKKTTSLPATPRIRIRIRTRVLGSKTSFPTHGVDFEGLLRKAFLCGHRRCYYRTRPGEPKSTGVCSKVGRVIMSNHVTDRLRLQREVPCSRAGDSGKQERCHRLLCPVLCHKGRKEG